MFNQLVVSGRDRRRTHTRWTLIVSLVGQAAVLAVLILIPLIYTQALPTAILGTMLLAPPPPPPPPPPPKKNVAVVKPPPSFIQNNQMVAPKVLPKHINIISEPQTPTMGPNSIYNIAPSTGIPETTGTEPAPPPPAVTKTITVVSTVQNAKLLHQVLPRYPDIAREARVQGTVVLRAIIAKNGTISQLQYVSGPALLVQAAEAAVRQWAYQPTLLNGQPVQVDTVIRVTFTLNE